MEGVKFVKDALFFIKVLYTLHTEALHMLATC